MTYSLVQAGTLITATTGTTVTPTCAASTVHNLLVLCLGAGNAGGYSLPAGWIAGNTIPNVAADEQVWYYPDCPAGITSVVVTSAGGFGGTNVGVAQILEFHDSAGTNTSPLDVNGTSYLGSGATSPQAIATSAAAAAHDLAVSVGYCFESSSSKNTLVSAAGFTQAGNYGNGVKQNQCVTFDYLLDTGASSGTVTDSMTFVPAGTVTFAGAIATFKVASAGAPAGLLPQQLRGRSPLQPISPARYGPAYR